VTVSVTAVQVIVGVAPSAPMSVTVGVPGVGGAWVSGLDVIVKLSDAVENVGVPLTLGYPPAFDGRHFTVCEPDAGRTAR
jgi:hypothetical protein